MDSLREIVPRMMKSIGLDKRYKAEMIIFNWRQIVGDEVAANTRPIKIGRGVLTLAAKNAVWAHHLSTLKEEIIVRINAFAGEKAVNDLKFQAGYLRIDQNEENGDEGYAAPKLREIPLESGETKKIEEITAPMADDLLRTKVKRLLVKEFAFRKFRRKQKWQPCTKCGILRPDGDDLCVSCATVARAAGRECVRKLLRDAPWLGYDECVRYIACRRSDFAAARDELADILFAVVGRDENDKVALPLLTMLYYRVGPQDLTEEMIATMLEKVRRKGNVSTSRR
ncbi:DUF721 domain-containing protein [Anaeroselena agilis]|uniref:DUF721 domain-containing protein n=1 Tax=Anaeroselena agilis TaxID=3063788 RepID=A0ABU3P3W7_9FIRM|nr:DUF721 domain-containing protein [Selenomonadales bacterium 4137-cl]